MQLRQLKVHISWFFLMVLTLGIADFSLHSIAHEHVEAHDSYHSEFKSFSKTPKGDSAIFSSEQECLRCGQFLIHTSWAVADLVFVFSPNFNNAATAFSQYHLISSKLPVFFLRGPPKA